MIRWYRHMSKSTAGNWVLMASVGDTVVAIRPTTRRYKLQLMATQRTNVVLLTELFDTEEAAKERGEVLLLLGS